MRRMSITYDKLRKGDVIVTPERVTVWIDRPDAQPVIKTDEDD